MERAMKFSVVQFVHFCVVLQFIGSGQPAFISSDIPNILMVYTLLSTCLSIYKMCCCRCYTLAAVTIFAEGFDEMRSTKCMYRSLFTFLDVLSFATHTHTHRPKQTKCNTQLQKLRPIFKSAVCLYSLFFHFFFFVF